jgi:sec-independent protein translocase protein TatB
MFDIGWVEMMIVVVVMIVVIGPKDLPVVLHTMGRWIARVRAMARGFQDSIEEMAEEAGLDQVRNEARSIRDFSLDDEIEKAIDPEGELNEAITGDPARVLESDEDSAGGDQDGAEVDDRAEEPGDVGKGAPVDVTPEPGAPARREKT